MGISAFALSRELYSRLRSWSAGRALFRDMLSAVLYAPMTFYDTTPLGRIINRFSKVCVCVSVCVHVLMAFNAIRRVGDGNGVVRIFKLTWVVK